ncbi:peroxisome biogenesis factor 10 isoform X1 [Cherax quadricarinatus]|uniref:peroxisome biogenesis factor 10 isoform X1 n=1 Tax=Cherax quadricarinatus TaxID=27406 RepID=UPI002379F60F|nr:peroxisome biogenesis factor 10-like isoform X1 [Cherax quadricarinatus]XP_053641565.1 peroxisome biogenesis factor 10-like isoform X1 [Cherax quadricarinatus]XP_053641567.1 peroxisome biogenesis factor 10-like isoform X1 [Cherax quadricarinatus]
MPFQQAGAAEVLRASQKDESFVDYLKNCVSEIVQRSAGTRVWLDIHKYAECLCEFAYYSLTTLCLRQTLGEEYTGILQVNRTRKSLPNTLERVTMVMLKCFGPEVIHKALCKLENSARSGKLSSYLRPELKNLVLQHMPTLRYSITLLHRIHLATFYFSGAFYHLSKRLTGIKYVLVREWFGDNSATRSFQILGMVLLTHIILTTVSAIYTQLFFKPPPESTQPLTKDGGLSCLLLVMSLMVVVVEVDTWNDVLAKMLETCLAMELLGRTMYLFSAVSSLGVLKMFNARRLQSLMK